MTYLLTSVFKIVIAVICGCLIGIERTIKGRIAGIRTHILVCMSSALTMIIGLYTVDVLGYDSDPIRIGAQVVSGIGFLGVGTILVPNFAASATAAIPNADFFKNSALVILFSVSSFISDCLLK